MKDLTRKQALQWCHDQQCNFIDPVFPPPGGWMWADGDDGLILTPVFTITDQGEEITREEVEAIFSTRQAEEGE